MLLKVLWYECACSDPFSPVLSGIRSVKDRDKGRFGKGREEDLVRDSDKGKSSKKRRKSSSGL